MRIGVEEARGFFEHHSQQKKGVGLMPDQLPDDGSCEYWAIGGICGIFHQGPVPNSWTAHCGVKPAKWGALVNDAKDIMMEFWAHHSPDVIVAMPSKKNRAVIAFDKRVGFKEVGTLSPMSGELVILEWKPCLQQQ